MTEYVVGKKDEIASGTAVAVQAGRHIVAVFRIGDDFFALNNACPHKGASLCEGEIVAADKVVRCPWHHWNWQLDDGKLQSDPRQGTRRYEIAVEGEDVILRA
jgi:nitrite reductase (NADH) small subunit/3-phenylpropionate/trans-cinnamate dioxygenase ferredoxin subunit